MFRINQSAFDGGLSLKKLLMLTCLASASLLLMSLSHAQAQVTPGEIPVDTGGREVTKLKEQPTIPDCNEWLDKNEAFLPKICRDNEIRQSMKSCFEITWAGPMKSMYEYSCTSFTDEYGNQSAPLYFRMEKQRLISERQKLLGQIAKETNALKLRSMKGRLEALTQEIDYLGRIMDKMDESCRNLDLQARKARERSYALELLCGREYDQN